MNDLSAIINVLSHMKSGVELQFTLEVLPEYDDAICAADAPVRLMALSDLYRVYVPNQMSLKIYSKLYLALIRSLQKKGTKLMIQQQNQNFKAIMQQEYSGIMGGSDSITIIGASGIGKSLAISRAITLITENRVIEVDSPYTKIIPCICVQCPFDSSVKGLLLEAFRKIDEAIDSNYCQNALRARATTDMLIGSVSQVAFRNVTKKGAFPSEDAVLKALCLRLTELYKKWAGRPAPNWAMVRNQLSMNDKIQARIMKYEKF